MIKPGGHAGVLGIALTVSTLRTRELREPFEPPAIWDHYVKAVKDLRRESAWPTGNIEPSVASGSRDMVWPQREAGAQCVGVPPTGRLE